MKKISYFAAASFFAVMLTGCDKENPNPGLLPEMDDGKAIALKITHFREAVLNQQKSAETFTVEEAIVLLEGSFNYFHGFADIQYSETYTDTVIVNFDYNTDDLITTNELNPFYIYINNSVYDIYTSCEFSGKHIKYIDLELINLNDTNKLKIWICIGNTTNLKGTQVTNSTMSWPNATPFNSQAGQMWDTGGLTTAFDNTVHYLTNNSLSSALNEKLIAPYQNSNTFIYWVENTGYKWDPYLPDITPVYISNPDISAPNDEYSCWEGNHCFFCFAGPWNGGYNPFCNNIMGFIDYKHMNKYYNVCIYAVDFYKPNRKEAIDIEFCTIIADNHNCGYPYREVIGSVKITYASKKYIDQIPRSDPQRQ